MEVKMKEMKDAKRSSVFYMILWIKRASYISNKPSISVSLMCDMSLTRGNSYCDWADPDKALERAQIFQLFVRSPEIEADFSLEDLFSNFFWDYSVENEGKIRIP